jgi:hypothetical protein
MCTLGDVLACQLAKVWPAGMQCRRTTLTVQERVLLEVASSLPLRAPCDAGWKRLEMGLRLEQVAAAWPACACWLGMCWSQRCLWKPVEAWGLPMYQPSYVPVWRHHPKALAAEQSTGWVVGDIANDASRECEYPHSGRSN